LLAADHPLDVTKRYYEHTGFPKLPPPWALGPLVWRDENADQAQFEADLDTMRDLDLPASGVWIDRPYATAVNTFDFDPAKFPDPAAAVTKARALGYRVSLWHVPYLDDSNDATLARREEAEENGYFPLETGLLLNGWGVPIDFTADGATAWWQSKLDAYRTLGFEGYKLDYGEDVVPGVFGARNVYRFADGSDERTMHRDYTLAYHDAYTPLLPDEGGLLLCRAGKWGTQTRGPVIWPGDLDARMVKHREEFTVGEETFVGVGGLHAAVVASIGLGPSGFPFFGSDTGGYRHAPPDKETFRRWFEHTALTSVMQIGTSTNDVAWEFDDAALLASYREYTRLHLRLFPYTWTLASAIETTGRPIQRPFGLAEPSVGLHPSDAYFYGEALLVAPVTEAGAESRNVPFPPGKWVNFWDGTALEGPGEGTIAAPLGTLPLFVRGGALVPMLRPTIDTLSPTTEPDRVDSFATDAGPLWVLATEGPASALDLYDGTRVAQAPEASGLRLEVREGATFMRGAVFEVIGFGETPPRAVRIDGDPVRQVTPGAIDSDDPAWSFEPGSRGGRLLVSVRRGEHAVVVER
jgi:alpha-D-xyloside xylohydrolase